MIAFSCTHCSKQLKVKDELAGKKAKCPGCGQPVVVPALAAATSISPVPSPDVGDRKAPPPSVSSPNEERTLPPKNPDQSGKESLIAGGETAIGADAVSGGEPNSDLWDFLAPAQNPDEIGRLGPYRVLKMLGAGGMGVVFRAEDPHLKRLVALKAMLPTMAKSPNAKVRFFREAQAAAALKHPHIVTIFQVGEDRGAPYLAMEFLEGESLDDRLKRETRLQVPDILRIGREIAKGLAAAHDKGLIHRDIKPGNVWLESPESHVKILDFGLARAMSDQAQLTQSGAIVGTPAYMAPEQAGGKQVDGRCDLFSLGCVLYRMCTGEMPFKGTDTISILSALLMEVPPPASSLNPEIPTELSDLVMQLLAKKPEQRPQDARTVAETLLAVMMQSTQPLVEAIAPTASFPVASAVEITSADPWQAIDESTPSAEATRTVPSATPVNSSGRKSKKGLLIGGGLLGLLALIAIIVIVINNKHGTVTESKGPGERNVEATRNGKVAPPPAPEKKTEAIPAQFRNNLGMKFIWIPPGSFTMGSPLEEIGRGKKWDGQRIDETPHKVTLAKGFYMGEYTVTQEQWQEVMGNNPSHFKGEKDLPVEMVSWDDCQEFIRKLREKDKKPYRLPFEAEWEYACRAGTTKPFHFGETISTDQANYNGRIYGNGKEGINRSKTTPVGSFPANAFGLHDMHGNVWQWCQDWLGDYPHKDLTDPQGPEIGTKRVVRGGCWLNSPQDCRSASRDWDVPGSRNANLGFRLCLSVEEDSILAPKKNNTKKDVVALPPPFVPPTFDEKEAKKQQEDWAAKLKLPVEATNKLGMKMILIPPAGEALPKAYYLGKYEVTQGEWEKVMGYNPSGFGPKNAKVAGMDTSKFPVEMLNWFDSVEFCNKLSEQEGMKPYYDLKVTKRAGKQIDEAEVKILGGSGYHIPTDMEWDRGCRAGTKTRYHFGGGEEDLLDYAWFEKNSDGRPHAVGEKKPNGFGLYDMHGNVWEWNEEMLTHATTGAPERVIRGGDWNHLAGYCAVNHRTRPGPAARTHDYGLRLARVAEAKAPVVKAKDGPLSEDPDRRAAEYVLSIGGIVRVNELDDNINGIAALPREAFRLTSVDLERNKQATDEALAVLKDCKSLMILNLWATPVSDAGLAHFRDCKNLIRVDLNDTKVSDTGLVHLKDCKNLVHLNLSGTGVSDAGLVHFKVCKGLKSLLLWGTKVTDAGLVQFEGCKELDDLSLGNTQVSDAGLTPFKDCQLIHLKLEFTRVTDAGLVFLKESKNLRNLYLRKTRVTDKGLASVKGCKNLTNVDLIDTAVSDVGLDQFKDCKNLTLLRVQGTKVTAAKILELNKALPQCKIEWDGGVIEPKK